MKQRKWDNGDSKMGVEGQLKTEFWKENEEARESIARRKWHYDE